MKKGNKKPKAVLTATLTLIVLFTTRLKADNSIYYEIWRSESNDITLAEPIEKWRTEPNWTDADAQPGTRYYYWVRAISAQQVRVDFGGNDYIGDDTYMILTCPLKTKKNVSWKTTFQREIYVKGSSSAIPKPVYDFRCRLIDDDIAPAPDQILEENLEYDITVATDEPALHEIYQRSLLNVYQYDDLTDDMLEVYAELAGKRKNHIPQQDFVVLLTTNASPVSLQMLDSLSPPPANLTAQVVNDQIYLSWNEVIDSTEFTKSVSERIPTTIYVDHAGTAAEPNGNSWQTAYYFLRDALLEAEYGDEIHVAAPALNNKYYPDTSWAHPTGSDDRVDTFSIPNGVKVYGGFPTHGGDPNIREPEVYVTTLSGDINVPGDPNDNSLHVVTMNNCDANTLLDGFVIESGFANKSDPNNKGAGIFMDNSQAHIKNCIITSNAAEMGSGIYCTQSSSSIVNCLVRNNYAAIYGGAALYNQNSNTTVVNSKFLLNVCNVNSSGIGGSGGAVYNENAEPEFINCEFKCNTAIKAGGGVYNWDSEPEFINCTFSGNIAGLYGGGMFNSDSTSYSSLATIRNCVFWGNTDINPISEHSQIFGYTPVVYYSCIQDEMPDDGNLPFSGMLNFNIDNNPLFVTDPNPGPDGQWNTADDCIGDTKLAFGSPCIEIGNNSYLLADIYDIDDDDDKTEPVPLDAAGHPRLLDNNKDFTATVDMGAYERGICPGNPDFDDSGLVNFKDFAMLAERWLDTGCDCYGSCCEGRDINGDDFIGFDDITVMAYNWLSGFILLADDFGSGSLTLWEINEGSWAIENGKLKGVGAGHQKDGWIYSGDQSWMDYSVEADVDMTSGNCEFVLRSTGHWQDEYRIEIFQHDHSQYPNRYAIHKYQQGTGSTLIDSNANGKIFIPSVCHIKLAISGDTISLYIENEHVDTVTDPNPLTNGRFGLGMLWSYTCYFDNVVVKQI